MCLRPCVSVHPSKFARTITSTIADRFRNNLTLLFSIMRRYAIWNICSGRPQVKVTLEGQFFVRTIFSIIWDGFQYKFVQLSSIVSRCAIWKFNSGKSKIMVMRAHRVFPGQPSSFPGVVRIPDCLIEDHCQHSMLVWIDLYPYDVTFVNKYQSRCIMGLNGGNCRHIVVD